MKKLITAICAILISVGTLGTAGVASAAPASVQRPVETARTTTANPDVQLVDHRRGHRWDRRWERRHHRWDRRWDRRHYRSERRWDRRWDRRHYHGRPYRHHTGARVIIGL